MFSKIWTTKSTGNFSDNINRLKNEMIVLSESRTVFYLNL